jgi:hypothetical protein
MSRFLEIGFGALAGSQASRSQELRASGTTAMQAVSIARRGDSNGGSRRLDSRGAGTVRNAGTASNALTEIFSTIFATALRRSRDFYRCSQGM